MAKPKLTAKEEKALREVRAALAAGHIVHRRESALDKISRRFEQAFGSAPAKFFNMGTAASDRECGSVGCIGGWMAASMGKSKDEAQDFVNIDSKFGELFFPGGGTSNWEYDHITEKHAIKAIDNFLKCGDPKWLQVLRGTKALPSYLR